MPELEQAKAPIKPIEAVNAVIDTSISSKATSITCKVTLFVIDIIDCNSKEEVYTQLTDHPFAKEIGLSALAKTDTIKEIFNNYGSTINTVLGFISAVKETIFGPTEAEFQKAQTEIAQGQQTQTESFSEILSVVTPREKHFADKDDRSEAVSFFTHNSEKNGAKEIPDYEVAREKFVAILSANFVNSAELSDLKHKITTNDLAPQMLNQILRLLKQVKENKENGFPILPLVESSNSRQVA